MTGQAQDHAPLEARGLGVRYGGKRVLEDISFRIEPGQVYALLGRNGAGKSSLVRCLLGWQAPSAGQALLWGRPAWSCRTEAMRRVGVVQESPDVPPRMRIRDVMAFCEALYPVWDRVGVEAKLKACGIEPPAPAGSLSRGQKTQLGFALALAHKPSLLVLDDPTMGLDAVARRLFVDLLVEELAAREITVLLCTHDLAGVEGLADRVGILSQRSLAVNEPLEALKARMRRLRWAPGSPRPAGIQGLGILRESEGPFGHEALVSFYPEGGIQEFPDLRVEPLSLEESFIALTDPGQEVRA